MLNGPRSRILVEGLRACVLLLLPPALLITGAWFVGSNLPEDHTATASGVVHASPERVEELLNDYSAQENWRHGPLILVRGPVKQSAQDHCWMEGWSLTKVVYCTAASPEPNRRVVQTDSPDLPFDATWTFVFAPVPNQATATALTITEQTTIDSPLLRFMGRYVMRRRTAASQYLSDLQAEAVRHP